MKLKTEVAIVVVEQLWEKKGCRTQEVSLKVGDETAAARTRRARYDGMDSVASGAADITGAWSHIISQ